MMTATLNTSTATTTTICCNVPINEPYYIIDEDILGPFNQYDITINNPLKGLADTYQCNRTYPVIEDEEETEGVCDTNENNDIKNERIINMKKNSIHHTLEFSYLRFDSIYIDENQYNWDVLDDMLNDCEHRHVHLIPRVFIHYHPYEVSLPEYLKEKVELRSTNTNDENACKSPYYGDIILLDVIKKFIIEYGKRYNHDKRIGFLQLGILGYWGEWHTHPNQDLIPDYVRDLILLWYSMAFPNIKCMTRYPDLTAYYLNIGYHDDSFTFTTLDGIYNGGNIKKMSFYKKLQSLHIENDYWKTTVMGGETYPNNVSYCLDDTIYNGNQVGKQNFIKCCEMTHTTYMKQSMFTSSNNAINNANYIHTHMGYNFQIKLIYVYYIASFNMINIHVTIEQIGIAPFYYPLSLRMIRSQQNNNNHDDECTNNNIDKCHDDDNSQNNNNNNFLEVHGIETLIEQNEMKEFIFSNVSYNYINIPLTFSLYSERLYSENPIKWAQGITNGTIQNIMIPYPPTSCVESK